MMVHSFEQSYEVLLCCESQISQETGQHTHQIQQSTQLHDRRNEFLIL